MLKKIIMRNTSKNGLNNQFPKIDDNSSMKVYLVSLEGIKDRLITLSLIITQQFHLTTSNKRK